MGPIFQANEVVKESMVLKFFAKLAKTVLHKNGTLYLSDPFLETEIIWESPKDFKKISPSQTLEISEILFELKEKVEEMGGQMTPPIFEFKNKRPVLVWALFFTRDVAENS
jgi:hypothetical protein